MEKMKTEKNKQRLKKLAQEFQEAAIVLSFLEMGTQRRQVITAFTTKVIY